MNWSSQSKIPNTNFYDNVWDQYSKCSAVHFDNHLYLFFPFNDKDSGNRTVGYTIYNGSDWTQTKTLSSSGVALANDTSPCAVVYRGTIYVFYNGSGNNGTWYASGDDKNGWKGMVSIGDRVGQKFTFLRGTSPSASVNPGGSVLSVFWNNSNDNTIWYATSTGNDKWTGLKKVSAQYMGVADLTSTAGLARNANTLLFYNGVGNNGTWLTKYSDHNATWVNPNKAGAGGFLPGTSPAAWKLPDNAKIGVVWCGSGNDGRWCSTSTDGGTTWDGQAKVNQYGLYLLTSPAAVSFRGASYVFWYGSGGDGIWFCTAN